MTSHPSSCLPTPTHSAARMRFMQTYLCPSGHVVLLDDDVLLPGKLSIGSHGYAQVTGVIKGRVELFHRWLMGCRKGDGKYVDHRDRNRLNCQRSNLVVTDARGNSENQPRPKGGAYLTRSGRWAAAGKTGGRKYHLGVFDTQEEALAVARAFRREHLPMATN